MVTCDCFKILPFVVMQRVARVCQIVSDNRARPVVGMDWFRDIRLLIGRRHSRSHAH